MCDILLRRICKVMLSLEDPLLNPFTNEKLVNFNFCAIVTHHTCFNHLTGLNSGMSSAMGTPYTFGSGALRLSRTFSGATGAGEYSVCLLCCDTVIFSMVVV